MKNFILLLIALLFYNSLFAQAFREVTINNTDGSRYKITESLPTTVPLKNVTFGFATGYSRTFGNQQDYSLLPDSSHLKIQNLSNNAFVISTMLTVKLSPLAEENGHVKRRTNQGAENAAWCNKLALNVGLNLVEISDNVSFNKSIDGGIGLGYFFQTNAVIAFMLDFSSRRQLRDHIVAAYNNKRIPKSTTEFFTALDVKDDNLFYNKGFTGCSIKIVFALGDKKND